MGQNLYQGKWDHAEPLSKQGTLRDRKIEARSTYCISYLYRAVARRILRSSKAQVSDWRSCVAKRDERRQKTLMDVYYTGLRAIA